MFGKLVEQELLGSVKQELAPFSQLHEIKTEYLGYRPAVDYVKTHQRGDPYHPKRFFPKSLIEKLRTTDDLNIKSEQQLGYYTAVGSALDLYHGVDAFFEYRTERKTITVTIDVTMNSKKDRYKADVILEIPSGGLDTGDAEYNNLIEMYSGQIREEILTKLNK